MSGVRTRAAAAKWRGRLRRSGVVVAPALVAGAALLALPTTPAQAQQVTPGLAHWAGTAPNGWATGRQVAKLKASDGAALDQLGSGLALSSDGSTAVVGAFGHSSQAGAAYVYAKGHPWQQVAELSASDGVAGDEFGSAVAVSSDGSTIVVGAFAHKSETGAVYVFSESGGTWTQTAELTAPDGVAGDEFGSALAVSADGSAVLVGAEGVDHRTGAAYLFSDTGGGWAQTAELTASHAARKNDFGNAVALSSDGLTAVIGAVGCHDFTGSAYVFTDGGGSWTQSARLGASDATTLSFFGDSVSMSSDGSAAVVGAQGHRGLAGGAAYVFADRGRKWRQTAELTASDGASYNGFGVSVSVSAKGSTAIVGASNTDNATGAAYVFADEKGQWKQKAELTASDGREYMLFGDAVSISAHGASALIGSPGEGNPPQLPGEAYIFASSGPSEHQPGFGGSVR